MAESSVIKKLLIKPGYRMLLLNAPEGYQEKLAPLPERANIETTAKGQYEWVLVFVSNKADVDRQAVYALQSVKTGTLVWFAYPKKNANTKTDISRDAGWDAILAQGWEGVSLIAIDAVWSAMRFRPLSEVKTRPK